VEFVSLITLILDENYVQGAKISRHDSNLQEKITEKSNYGLDPGWVHRRK